MQNEKHKNHKEKISKLQTPTILWINYCTNIYIIELYLMQRWGNGRTYVVYTLFKKIKVSIVCRMQCNVKGIHLFGKKYVMLGSPCNVINKLKINI